MDNKGLVMNRLKMGLGLTVALALTGCGDSPPECDDSDVTDTVIQIMINEFRQAEYAQKAAASGVYDELNYEKAVIAQEDNELLRPFVKMAEDKYPDGVVEVDAIRTESVQEELLKTSCIARFAAEGSAGAEMRYSAQVTEDGEVWIEVYGL